MVHSVGPDSASNRLMPLEYQEEEDEVLIADEEIEIEAAADTGAVDHVTPPSSLPGSVVVRRCPRTRNFVAANNEPIVNHGEAVVLLQQESGAEVLITTQVADVSRPLHSISKICDEEHEMLFTKTGGTVVPAGALSRYLHLVKNLAKYPRRGGLYVAKMRARAPKTPRKSGFTRPGNRR